MSDYILLHSIHSAIYICSLYAFASFKVACYCFLFCANLHALTNIFPLTIVLSMQNCASCRKFKPAWDSHDLCPRCRSCTMDRCRGCTDWTDGQWTKLRDWTVKKDRERARERMAIDGSQSPASAESGVVRDVEILLESREKHRKKSSHGKGKSSCPVRPSGVGPGDGPSPGQDAQPRSFTVVSAGPVVAGEVTPGTAVGGLSPPARRSKGKTGPGSQRAEGAAGTTAGGLPSSG